MIEKIKSISKSLNEPEWLLKARLENWENFQNMEMPKDDEWKYTNTENIDFSDISSLKLNINMVNCKESKDFSHLKNYFSAKNKFDAFNNAVFSDAKIIYTGKDARIDIDFSQKFFSKIFIFIEQNAEINFVTRSTSLSINHAYLFVKGHAILNVYDYSSKDSVTINECFAKIEKDAKLDCRFALFGSTLNRFKLESIIGMNAESKTKGIFFGDDTQHFNITTNSIHVEESSVNDILVKGALKDYATSSYFGSIVIDKNAQKSDSYLADHVLLLSEDVKANSIPSLRIDANDVRATHGATITQLDEEQLFYLMSRGLQREAAEYMAVQAFFNDVNINNSQVIKIIEEKIK